MVVSKFITLPVLLILLIGVSPTSAITYSKPYTNDKGTKITLGVDISSNVVNTEDLNIVVFFRLDFLQSEANDVHDVKIRVSVSGNGMYTESSIVFLNRDTDSLISAGDQVTGTVTINMAGFPQGEYQLNAEATFREDISFATDPTYSTGVLTMTTISFSVNFPSAKVSIIGGVTTENSASFSNFVAIIFIGVFVMIVVTMILAANRSTSSKYWDKYSSQKTYSKEEDVKTSKGLSNQCMICGTPVGADDKFCPNCGTKLS